MADPITIQQSRLGLRTSFTFGDERVTHSVRDNSGEREYSVGYDLLDFDEMAALSIPSGKPTMYLWAAGFPLGFFALRISYGHEFVAGTMGALAFALIFCGILAKDRKWFRIRLDLVPVAVGSAQSLRVLRDRQHDRILALLIDGRRRVLRAKYAKIDPELDPETQRRRFRWLLDIGMIDADEHMALATELNGWALVPTPPTYALN